MISVQELLALTMLIARQQIEIDALRRTLAEAPAERNEPAPGTNVTSG